MQTSTLRNSNGLVNTVAAQPTTSATIKSARKLLYNRPQHQTQPQQITSSSCYYIRPGTGTSSANGVDSDSKTTSSSSDGEGVGGGARGGGGGRARAYGGGGGFVTELMYAAQQGKVDRVRHILHSPSKNCATRQDRAGNTALHYCCTSDSVHSAEAADLLVMAAPQLMESKDEDGFTPLHLAVIAGNLQLVNFLLANNANVAALDNEKHTVVHWATVCGEIAALRAVLEAGAPVSTPDLHGGYPIHYAAQMCGGEKDSTLGFQVLQTLLSHKHINISVTDKDQRTPLLWAASAGSAKAILALIRAGAAVEVADKDGLTALHCAASRGHTDCIDTLLTLCGAHPDVIDSNGCTALHYAVTLGHADATAILLAHGADPNRQDRKGRTPAHCGCAKGQFETVKLIYTHGANLWLKNAKGDLPLHEAAGSERRELVTWLLDMRPSNVNARNNDGKCPLHMAALNDNVDMCKILLDAGANVNPIVRTSKNTFMTPLDCALQRGFRSTAKYLQLQGGIPASKIGVTHKKSKIQTNDSVNFSIRNDITFGPMSSASESDEEITVKPSASTAGASTAKKRLSSKKVSCKAEKKIVTSTSVSPKGKSQKGKIKGAVVAQTESTSPLLKEPLNDDQKRASPKEPPCYNEIIINGKTKINIHQTKEIIIDRQQEEDKAKLLVSESSKLVEKIVNSEDSLGKVHLEAGLESSNILIEPVAAESKHKSEMKKSKKKLKKKLAESEQSQDKDKESKNKELKDKEIKDTEIKHKEVKDSEMKEGDQLPEVKIESDKNLPNEEDTEKIDEFEKKSHALPDQQSLVSNTSEDIDDVAKSEIVEVAIHAPPKNVETSESKELKSEKTQIEIDTKNVDTEVLKVSEKTAEETTKIEKVENEEIKTTVEENDGAATKSIKVTEESSRDSKESKKVLIETETKKDDQLVENSLIQKDKEDTLKDVLGESVSHDQNIEKLVSDSIEIVEDSKANVKSENISVETSKNALIDSKEDKIDEKDKTDKDKAAQSVETLSSETNEEPLADEKKLIETSTNQIIQESVEAAKETQKLIEKSSSDLQDHKIESKKSKESETIATKTKSKAKTTEKSNQKGIKEKPDQSKTKKDQQNQQKKESKKSDLSSLSSDLDKEQILESTDTSSSSMSAKTHKSFRVLDDDELQYSKNEKNNKLRNQSKKSRSKSEEMHHRLKQQQTKSSKIPTLHPKNTMSKSDINLDRLSKDDKVILPSIGDSATPRPISNLSAPQLNSYSDNENDSLSEGEMNARRSTSSTRRKKLRKRSKRDSKSAGSGYESSNLIDSGFEPSPRSTKIPKWKNMSDRGVAMTSVTQSIQSNIRRYHLERKIFEQLLELKRLQIRSGVHNEAVLVKRAIDAYNQSCMSTVGAGRYVPEELTFKSFEKFLYQALRELQKHNAEYLKGLPEFTDPLHCTKSTHRCMHATHAYTGVPCAAYLPRMDHHTIPKIGFGTNCRPGTSFLPIINSSASNRKAVTLELNHGFDKQIILLPTDRLDQNKRYYVTFTVKGQDEPNLPLTSTKTAEGKDDEQAHRHPRSD